MGVVINTTESFGFMATGVIRSGLSPSGASVGSLLDSLYEGSRTGDLRVKMCGNDPLVVAHRVREAIAHGASSNLFQDRYTVSSHDELAKMDSAEKLRVAGLFWRELGESLRKNILINVRFGEKSDPPFLRIQPYTYDAFTALRTVRVIQEGETLSLEELERRLSVQYLQQELGLRTLGKKASFIMLMVNFFDRVSENFKDRDLVFRELKKVYGHYCDENAHLEFCSHYARFIMSGLMVIDPEGSMPEHS